MRRTRRRRSVRVRDDDGLSFRDWGVGEARERGEEAVLLGLLEEGGERRGVLGVSGVVLPIGSFRRRLGAMVLDERGVDDRLGSLERGERVSRARVERPGEDAERRARSRERRGERRVRAVERVEARPGLRGEGARGLGVPPETIDGGARLGDERVQARSRGGGVPGVGRGGGAEGAARGAASTSIRARGEAGRAGARRTDCGEATATRAFKRRHDLDGTSEKLTRRT